MVTVAGVNLDEEFKLCLELYNNKKYAECYKKIVPVYNQIPDNLNVKYVTGTCLLEMGMVDEAEKILLECFDKVKNHEHLLSSIGRIYDIKMNLPKAVEFYNKSLEVNPNNICSVNNLGNIYNSIGRNDEALKYFNRLIELGYENYIVYNNIALVYKRVGMLIEAEKYIRKSLSFMPETSAPYHNAALIYTSIGHRSNAVKCYERAYKYSPDNAQIISEYSDMCRNVCDWKKQDELEKKLEYMQKEGGADFVVSPMVDIQQNIDPKHNLKMAKSYTKAMVKNILGSNKVFDHKNHDISSRKIRIGYVSSDICDHPVAHLMRGVFRLHNKNEFEIYLYSSSGTDKTGYKDEIKSYCDKFVDALGMTSVALARRIYDDGVDILIDLNGHTGSSRIEALALKPAPVQVNYIGYIGSMGADFIDYIITDKIVTPPDQQKFYTEKFMYMPNCYQPNDDKLQIDDKPVSRKDFGLPENGFVFCSFNQTAKIDKLMFSSWMKILKEVSESVLWLYKGSGYNDDNMARNNLIKQAKEAGVDPERIIFADSVPIAKHLKRVQLADLALDTRIYNGGTVTSHTLWAGVPVLTLQGGHFASRMASSILNAVGMPELIVTTLDEYEKMAVKIASSKTEIKKFKTKLAMNKSLTPLFDAKRFTRDLEKLYKDMYNKMRASVLKQQINE